MNRVVWWTVMVSLVLSLGLLGSALLQRVSAQSEVEAYWGTAYPAVVRMFSSEPYVALGLWTSKLEELEAFSGGSSAVNNALHAAAADIKAATLSASGATIGGETEAPTFSSARAAVRAQVEQFVSDPAAVDAIMADLTASFLEHYTP